MKVSVIVPAFNADRTIGKTLGAIINQTGFSPAIEVIVVDDGSTDNTVLELAKFPQVTLLQQKNSGPAAARNTGAKAATGEIFVFTDSDTIPDPHWLQKIVAPFNDPSIMAATGTYTIANSGKSLAEIIQKEIEKRHSSYGDFVLFGGTYNLAVRKRLFDQLGGFDETYRHASGEDNDFCYRLISLGHLIKYVSEAKVAHHHTESVSRYLKEQYRHGFWRAKLYLEHPDRLSGDNYTGPRDILETLFSLVLIVLPVISYFRRCFAIARFLRLLPIAVCSGSAILFIEGNAAARQSESFGQFFQATAVFSLRAIIRTGAFICGLLFFAGKKFRRYLRNRYEG
jgi:glycosyltransferase involved in cell wall biosynthesis